MIPFTVSFGTLYASKILFVLPRCIESNALEKSINKRVAGKFLACTPSNIRRMVNICPDVDRLERKPF